ncbi:33978_t:CDS:2, partial [Racocetra persica]
CTTGAFITLRQGRTWTKIQSDNFKLFRDFNKLLKPSLSQEAKDERYKFAENHLHWTVNDWKK